MSRSAWPDYTMGRGEDPDFEHDLAAVFQEQRDTDFDDELTPPTLFERFLLWLMR